MDGDLVKTTAIGTTSLDSTDQHILFLESTTQKSRSKSGVKREVVKEIQCMEKILGLSTLQKNELLELRDTVRA